MAENVVLGGIGLGLLVITLGMSIFQEQFSGSDTLADNFDGIDAPNGFLSFLSFAKDLAIAVSKSVVDLMLYQVDGVPPSVNQVIAILWGIVFGVGLLLVLISVVA